MIVANWPGMPWASGASRQRLRCMVIKLGERGGRAGLSALGAVGIVGQCGGLHAQAALPKKPRGSHA